MAGPYPVVGLVTELTDAARRSTDQADITIDFINEHVIFVTFVEILDFHGVAAVFAGGLLQFLDGFGDLAFTLALLGVVGHALKNLGGHIFHTDEEGGGEAGVRELLFVRHGPEAVLQVVVGFGGVVGDGGITAVVVGEHQTVFGDDLTSAEVLAVVAQFHDGILQ